MLFEYRPSLEIVTLIGKIDEFKGAWRSLENISPERLAALKQVATIESIGSSTRIEGVKLSDQEVEMLLSGVGAESFSSRDKEEVTGYAILMETIFQNWENIPFTENHIKQLHSTLLSQSQKDDRNTPFQMSDLVAWTDENIQSAKIHPLIVVGAFTVKFLAIHPFQDGNGRLSRALTTLLLLKAGYRYVPYSSLESIIEKNKNAYYLALRKTQQSFKTDSAEWEHWMVFFLQAMEKQKVHLEEKIVRERILQGEMTPLSAQIVELLRQHGSLKMPQLISLTKENKSTLRTRILELEERNMIIHTGRGKNTWYALKVAKPDSDKKLLGTDEEPFWTGDDTDSFWNS